MLMLLALAGCGAKQMDYDATCTISISCATILDNMDACDPDKREQVPQDGVILAPVEVGFQTGENVFDVLQRVCRENRIQMESKWTPLYESAYIQGIHNLYEFDVGSGSGWMYSVNDWYPNYGCSCYTVQPGDVICWVYTCDLTMRYSDVFGSCHPAVNFLYFVLVIAFSMCLTHPVCLLLSVCGAVIYHAVLLGPRSLRKSAVWMVPMAVLAAVINPAFTHQGVTILAYLPSGNPLTLESMLYGLASAALLSATLLWFTCYNTVMTSDKFIYLFGRVIPALSLVLSMTMRFVPRFRTQLHTVAQAQKYMGRDTENGSLLRRTKNAMKVFSIMVTWSLESAIETADSMKSRGYGEKGRTAFSIYRMDDRDRSLLVWFIFCGAYVLCGVLAGGLRFRYYPSLAGAPVTPMTVSFFVVYFLLCLTPAALDLAAARQWKQIEKEVRR